MVAVTARGGSVELESLCLGIRLYVRTNARGLLLEHFPALVGSWLAPLQSWRIELNS